MKGKNRIFALLMSLALVLTYMPVFAFAEDGAEPAAPEAVEEALVEDADLAEIPADVVEESLAADAEEVVEVEVEAEEAAPAEAATAAVIKSLAISVGSAKITGTTGTYYVDVERLDLWILP